MAIANMHKKYGVDRACSSEDMIADRQTHTQRETDTQTRSSQYSAPLPGQSKYLTRRTAYTNSFARKKYKILNSLRNRGHKYSLQQIEATLFKNSFLNRCLYSYI